MEYNKHRYCVIMCGGIGSRFWPYSRARLPKQFIDFFGTGRSLLQMSYDRILPLVDKEHVIIVTNDHYAPLVREQLPELADHQILLEPARRNTAPCIAWAAHHIHALDPEASMIVTPSDHLITRELEFINSIDRGFSFVENNDALLTLGIKPTRPETGYGYIQVGSPVEGNDGILKVKTFTEKPDLDLAKVFVESGEFFWNSGIFLWSAKAILEALHMHAPDLTATFDRGLGDFATEREREFIEREFPSCVNISIDYAVMEKAQEIYVLPASFGWSDLGTWGALRGLLPQDKSGNATVGTDIRLYDSKNCIVHASEEKRVVVQGLDGYIIAEKDNTLLICKLDEEQRIKEFSK